MQRNAPSHEPPHKIHIAMAAACSANLPSGVTTTRRPGEATAPVTAYRSRRSVFDRGRTGLGSRPLTFHSDLRADRCAGGTGCNTLRSIAASDLGCGEGALQLSPDFLSTSQNSLVSRVASELVPLAGGLDWALPSIFSDDPARAGSQLQVSEYCQFNVREQEALLLLRQRLCSCLEAFEELRAALQDECVVALDLPSHLEACERPLESSLGRASAEEVVQSLGGDRLLRRLRGHTAFIDAALAGALLPGPDDKTSDDGGRGRGSGTACTLHAPSSSAADAVAEAPPAAPSLLFGPSKTPVFRTLGL